MSDKEPTEERESAGIGNEPTNDDGTGGGWDDTPDGETTSGEDDGGTMDERAGRLDEKEQRLAGKERELDRREEELDEREETILERREETVELREQLEDKERELEQREEDIAARETALDERERDLESWSEELDRREETLQQYVGDQLEGLENSIGSTVSERVQKAVRDIDTGQAGGRFGLIGGLLLALVGMVLVIGGVANGFATEIQDVPTLFTSDAGNFGASAVLIFSGLAANLAAATGRI